MRNDSSILQRESLLTFAFFLNRAFISFTYVLFLIHSMELYPTPIRSQGTSFCHFIGKVLGGAPSAYILDQFKITTGLHPMLCSSIAAIIGSITMLTLTETYGQKVQDTMPPREGNLPGDVELSEAQMIDEG
eukprot:TRINITY_DN7435_c0_g1_i3.p4 TRINITY_DN7435_c0_g1~~TRINITY_DN7435_c0_g1_i3.p4  ORF type:complete len:132 (-),score=2.56 TRINITY_DN7435_c0_g1_i3:280-675(-)